MEFEASEDYFDSSEILNRAKKDNKTEAFVKLLILFYDEATFESDSDLFRKLWKRKKMSETDLAKFKFGGI